MANGFLALMLLACAFSFTVEAALGFGATLLGLSLISLFLSDIREAVPLLLLPNLLLSLTIVVRKRKLIARDFLLKDILPLLFLGFPIGFFLARIARVDVLKHMYGVFLIVLSTIELRKRLRAHTVVAKPPPRALESALLFAGGVVHGMFTTSGPMVAYVAGRRLTERDPFRATLAAVFALLNIAMITALAFAGTWTKQTCLVSLMLVPSAIFGLLFGSYLGRKIPHKTFGVLIYVLLLISGLLFALRGIDKLFV